MTRQDPVEKTLGLLRDEVKSLADAIRALTKEVAVLKFGIPSNHDVEAMKAELRLVRSDVVSLDKKFSTVAETKMGA